MTVIIVLSRRRLDSVNLPFPGASGGTQMSTHELPPIPLAVLFFKSQEKVLREKNCLKDTVQI